MFGVQRSRRIKEAHEKNLKIFGDADSELFPRRDCGCAPRRMAGERPVSCQTPCSPEHIPWNIVTRTGSLDE